MLPPVSGRLLFPAIALFWVVMNVLLWRAEFGSGRETASEVPVSLVVDRILTAPDPSALRVRYHGEDLGLMRWMPTILEERPGTAPAAEDLPPEGMVTRQTGYQLELDFNHPAPLPADRWRVSAHLELDTNRVWRLLQVRVIRRPGQWEITADARKETVEVRVEEGNKAQFEHVFRPGDAREMSAWLGGYAALLPAPLRADAEQLSRQPAQLGLEWTASNDWLRVGQHRVRVYRLRARLFDRYEITAHLSRAGELLKVTFPDQLVLISDQIPGLR